MWRLCYMKQWKYYILQWYYFLFPSHHPTSWYHSGFGPPPQIWTRGPIRGGSKSSLQLLCRAGIEITLTPIANGNWILLRASRKFGKFNTVLVFCPNGEQGIDPNLYFKKVSCLLLVEVVFWFCCDIWGKWYVNRRSSFGMKC